MKLSKIAQKASQSGGFFSARRAEKLISAQELNAAAHMFLRLYPERTGQQGGALFGSVFAAKDNFKVLNQPLTFGLNPPLEKCSETEAGVIKLLSSRGAFLLGSTNLDEACLSYSGMNRHFGRIANPHDPLRSPLGSSGGSAAAVATGVVDFALGTDSGGSVRAPAAACRVCGMKFSKGVWPEAGMVVMSPDMESPGIFTACVEDLAFAYETCFPASAANLTSEKFVLLVPPQSELSMLSPVMAQAFMAALDFLKEHFVVRQLDEEVGFLRALSVRKVLAADMFRDFCMTRRLDSNRLGDAGRAILEFASRLSSSVLDDATAELELLQSQVAELLSCGGVLLSPTLPEEPPLWEALEKGQTERDGPLNFFLALANACFLPALSLPIISCEATPYFALQLCGRAGSDRELIAAGCLIENVFKNTKNQQSFGRAGMQEKA